MLVLKMYGLTYHKYKKAKYFEMYILKNNNYDYKNLFFLWRLTDFTGTPLYTGTHFGRDATHRWPNVPKLADVIKWLKWYKLPKIFQNAQNGPKWSKIVKKWSKMVKNDPKLSKIVQMLQKMGIVI